VVVCVDGVVCVVWCVCRCVCVCLVDGDCCSIAVCVCVLSERGSVARFLRLLKWLTHESVLFCSSNCRRSEVDLVVAPVSSSFFFVVVLQR